MSHIHFLFPLLVSQEVSKHCSQKSSRPGDRNSGCLVSFDFLTQWEFNIQTQAVNFLTLMSKGEIRTMVFKFF